MVYSPPFHTSANLSDLFSKDVAVKILGYNQSTNIAPLVQAFSTLNVDATLPGLRTKLLQSASLVVLNSTGHGNNITHASVSLTNPFTAGLSISQINSNITYLGISLGTISSSVAWNASGKSTTASPDLDMELNLDPQSLFTILRALAVTAGLGTEQLDGMVALGGYHYLPTTNISSGQRKRELSPRDNIYTCVFLCLYLCVS